MRLDSISRLRYFNDIAITGSFSRSARRLGIAQPALSIAIKKLEEETGLKLINRADRRMTLTSDGEVLLTHVRRILEGLTDATRELTELQGLEQGEVKLGASAMLSTYYLPAYLFAFKKAYPGIRIRLYEAGTDTLEQMVINGELDLALIRSEKPHDQIRYASQLSEQVVACMPKHHHLAERESITIEAFCQQPTVMFRSGYYLRDSVEQRARAQGLSLNVQFETNLVNLLMNLVKNEMGLATCLSMIVENEPLLCTRPFDPPIPLELAWGWKKNHYLSKASQAFLGFFEK
ncbi:MAG: LysR family transcriptional regulator [Saccharospirillum sp.]|uniref:LysR family transcriptional regulator n=1 Tax=Saccharospirillum sp. TaxID=2033801 RepID=UPI00349FE2B7